MRLPVESLVVAFLSVMWLPLTIQLWLVVVRVPATLRLISSIETLLPPITAPVILRTLLMTPGVRFRSGLLRTSSPGTLTSVWVMVITRRLLLDRALVVRPVCLCSPGN